MWITYLYASIVQLMLLSSVYVIYFQCTLLKGLAPVEPLQKYAPADRLLVFVVDGLSAQSFFEQRCRNVPHLRQIFLRQSQVGICYAPVTDKCRSAYVTLFAGRHEDYFAGLQGADLDTVFNRSTRSYAWGSRKVLQYFPDIHKAYTLPQNSLGLDEDSSMLDKWTFSALELFLKQEAKKLRDLHGLIFFVQLVGLQKQTEMGLYRDILNDTQRRIWKIYKRFEQTFPDRRTAYLLTSDHARLELDHTSDSHDQQMATPVLLWGSGVASTNASPGRSFVANELGQRLPLQVLHSVQLAPLMSGVLGLPPPLHNRGQLSAGLLNTSAHNAHAMYTNALQLHAQAQRALQQHQRGLLSSYMPGFWLNEEHLSGFVHSGNLLWHQQRYLTLIEYSEHFMSVLLQCVDYYGRYYRWVHLLAGACAYVGWLQHLRCQRSQARPVPCSLPLLLAEALLRPVICLLFGFVLLQRLPWLTGGLLLLLPGIIWTPALRACANCGKLMPFCRLLGPVLLSLSCINGCFNRRWMAFTYFSFACYHNRSALKQRSLLAYGWLLLICGLCGVSWLQPSLGQFHRHLLLASFLLTYVRPLACRTLRFSCALHRRSLVCNGLVLLAASLHVLLNEHPWMLHLLARAYMCYAFYQSKRQPSLELIVFNLGTLYSLLCSSYESLVIQALALELQLALRLKQEHNHAIDRKFTVAMYMVIYSFYSLYAIGKYEAIDKFLIHMNYTGFGWYSTLMNGLVVALKLLLPLLLMLVCIIAGNRDLAWTMRRQVFRRLLIMCNVMALVLLFCVRSQGILQDVSLRLNHLIIVQVLPFVLQLLSYLAHFMLGESAKDEVTLPNWNVRNF